ncbi:MAG: ABC transporter permease [bacterium]
MFKNYLKIAIRNLLRHKTYSGINIAGLAIGMACCLLILQFVAFELSFDTHHVKADRLFRVVRGMTQNGEFLGEMVWTGYGEAPSYAEEVPGLAQFARVHVYFGEPVVALRGEQEKIFKENRAYFVDPALLSMFTVPLITGDRASALTQPKTLLISESVARKYFGNDDAVGKVLSVHGSYAEGDYAVVGVFEDVPPTSHLQYELLFPMQDLLATDRYQNPASAWTNNNFYTYVEVSEGAEIADFEVKLTQSYTDHQRAGLESANRTAKMRLEPLHDIHLNGDLAAPNTVTGNRKTVYFFSIVALLTFLIALINYVNLSTARALNRAKEVGVRKVVGANRPQLVAQFLFESALMNLAALALAVELSFALVPAVNRLAEVQLSDAIWTEASFWSTFLLVFGAGVLFSGLYPAFVLSGFKPVAALKSKADGFTSRFALRKVLVVGQFAASISLLAGMLVVYTQVNYMRSMELGLELDRVLVIKAPRVLRKELSRDATLNTLKQELRKVAGVEEVAESATVPGKGFRGTISAKLSAGDLQGTIANAQELYETLFPGNPFEYFFADQEFDQLYKNDQRFASLFGVFAGLAILIACLGLLGLTTFTAQQRTKEVGIRKILGATAVSITALLSKDFVKLVLVANLVAWPIAWYAMNKWLQNFAYHVELGLTTFLLAAATALLIAFLTVSLQAIKAAMTNPIEALRYE